MLKGTMASASVIVSSELAYILELRHSLRLTLCSSYCTSYCSSYCSFVDRARSWCERLGRSCPRVQAPDELLVSCM